MAPAYACVATFAPLKIHVADSKE
uniref:Uncharacterized protein n=1 Tax=Anguilla anguilla TaxID=7936 RepID=A0A0E9USF6_ANGAN